MLSDTICAQFAMIRGRYRAFAPLRVHAGELPSLERPGLFGD
jgi:hypothetical protein